MINDKNKIDLLNHLVKNAENNQKIIETISREAQTIKTRLEQETSYDILIDQLILLDIISHRVSDETISMLQNFLDRLKTFEPDLKEEYYRKFHNSEKLMIQALGIICNLWDYETERVIDILFENVLDKEKNTIKEIEEYIYKIAKYDIDVYAHLGIAPQKTLIEKIKRFDDAQKEQYLYIITAICVIILHGEMENFVAKYKKIIIKESNIYNSENVDPDIEKIRSDAAEILKNIYSLAKGTVKKKHIIESMHRAITTPFRQSFNNPYLEIHLKDVIYLLSCLKDIASKENDMLVLEEIEDDVYWINRYYSETKKEIKESALDIRNCLDNNKEYKIFKSLLSDKRIFQAWEKENITQSYEDGKLIKELKVNELIDNFSSDSAQEWKERLFKYNQIIDSGDINFIPNLNKFIVQISKSDPDFAFEMLDNAEKITSFTHCFLTGLFESSERNVILERIKNWSECGKFLLTISHFLKINSGFYPDILSNVLNKAIEKKDKLILSNVMATVTIHYKENNQNMINNFFMPALDGFISQEKSWEWVYDFCYQQKKSIILADMNNQQLKKVLESFIKVPNINYNIDSILLVVAERDSELIIDFFCNRINYEKEQYQKQEDFFEITHYDPIPFNGLGELSEVLSKNIPLVLSKILQTYNSEEIWRFEYKGGRFIHHIFPSFSKGLENELIKIIHSNSEYWYAIISILKTYNGNPAIHEVCKELIKITPEDNKLLIEVKVTLRKTGVMSGEYGLAECYERKAQELQSWLDDPDHKIRSFAEKYISEVTADAEEERKRVDEQIMLMKHHYGE